MLLMLERFSYSDIWLTYVLLGIFVFIVILKEINAYKFSTFLQLGWSNTYIKHVLNSPKKNYLFTGLLLLISSSVYVFLYVVYINKFVYASNEINHELVYKSFIIILTYLLIKHQAQKWIGFIFDINPIINTYLSIKYNLLYYLGIISFIPLLLLVYSNLNKSIFQLMIVAFAAFYLLRIGLLCFKLRSTLFNHLFYFILYICTFEILPILFLIWYVN